MKHRPSLQAIACGRTGFSSGAVWKSGSSVRMAVRCCPSRPRRRPASPLSGRASNNAATAVWNPESSPAASWAAVTPRLCRVPDQRGPLRTDRARHYEVVPQVQQERAVHVGEGVGRATFLKHDLVHAGRSARELSSNTRPGADQFRCGGSSTVANARATSSRGSRSGTHNGRPRGDCRSVTTRAVRSPMAPSRLIAAVHLPRKAFHQLLRNVPGQTGFLLTGTGETLLLPAGTGGKAARGGRGGAVLG
jgi:hypothetical protein